MNPEKNNTLPVPGRCACHAQASWSRPIFGTRFGARHVWPGCPDCQGTAIGDGVRSTPEVLRELDARGR